MVQDHLPHSANTRTGHRCWHPAHSVSNHLKGHFPNPTSQQPHRSITVAQQDNSKAAASQLQHSSSTATQQKQHSSITRSTARQQQGSSITRNTAATQQHHSKGAASQQHHTQHSRQIITSQPTFNETIAGTARAGCFDCKLLCSSPLSSSTRQRSLLGEHHELLQ